MYSKNESSYIINQLSQDVKVFEKLKKKPDPIRATWLIRNEMENKFAPYLTNVEIKAYRFIESFDDLSNIEFILYLHNHHKI